MPMGLSLENCLYVLEADWSSVLQKTDSKMDVCAQRESPWGVLKNSTYDKWGAQALTAHRKGSWSSVQLQGRPQGLPWWSFQWLRLHVSNACDESSIPGQGTKIPHAMWCGQNFFKNKKFKDRDFNWTNVELWTWLAFQRSLEMRLEALCSHQAGIGWEPLLGRFQTNSLAFVVLGF